MPAGRQGILKPIWFRVDQGPLFEKVANVSALVRECVDVGTLLASYGFMNGATFDTAKLEAALRKAGLRRKRTS